MKGLMTPFLLFNGAGIVCSTIPLYDLVFSFLLDDSLVHTKDPSRGSERSTGRYLSNLHSVSHYYLRSHVILSVPPSLAGSHQGNLGKIHTGNKMRSNHTILFSVHKAEAARAKH